MYQIKQNNFKRSYKQRFNNLTTKVKLASKNALSLGIFLSHMVAGYTLHDSTNKVLAVTGVFLLCLGVIQLVSMSFKNEVK